MKQYEYIIGNNGADGKMIQISLSSDLGKHLSRPLFRKILGMNNQILGICLCCWWWPGYCTMLPIAQWHLFLSYVLVSAGVRVEEETFPLSCEIWCCNFELKLMIGLKHIFKLFFQGDIFCELGSQEIWNDSRSKAISTVKFEEKLSEC